MATPGTVGIIANPAAGKDIRRLVAQGRFVPNQEKVNILRRILAGLDAVGVPQVLIMPDSGNLGKVALDKTHLDLNVDVLEMTVFNEERDSTRAAEQMAELDVDCLVVLGGDGTSRAVAKGCGDIPLVAVSTGTNNVFPTLVEGTLAGLAAGLVAMGLVDRGKTTTVCKRVEVYQDGAFRDIALVDLAVSKERFVGARAIWDLETIHEIILARAEPASIGLSAIGGQLHPVSASDEYGLYARLGPGGTKVLAPVAPGMVIPVEVQEWSLLKLGEQVEIELSPSTLALDGERTLNLLPGQSARAFVSGNGPRAVSVEAALREAAENRVLEGELGRIASIKTDG